MRIARLIAAWLLAVPLIVFGGNHFAEFFTLPPGDGGPGDQLLQAMRTGGLMTWVAAAHVILGALLLVPRTRFVGALLHLPITLGILLFHITMLPEGNGMAAIMVTLNVLVLIEPKRWKALLWPSADASA